MKQPDIEIYLKEAPLSLITEWLKSALGECTAWQIKGNNYHCHSINKKIPINFYLKAVGNWHCLYFASNETPWVDDLSCAKEASSYLNTEIRCAPDGWSEEIEESIEKADYWLQVKQLEIIPIVWKTKVK